MKFFVNDDVLVDLDRILECPQKFGTSFELNLLIANSCITTKKLVFSDQINSGDPKVAANDPLLAATF